MSFNLKHMNSINSFFHLNAYLKRFVRFKIFHKNKDFWEEIRVTTNRCILSI